jgi:large conductance mechanosensitive channel
MKMIDEFKKFALKGNVVDMAIGIIIGAAFGKIVSSLVNDIIMPPLGLLVGGVDFTDLKITLKGASVDEAGKAISAVTMNYGTFLQTVFDFIIVAFITFMMIKAMNNMIRKQADAPAPPAEPSLQETLLGEIRDLLKK